MTVQDLIARIKTLPQKEAEKQLRSYLLGFIGPPRRGDILRNKFKRELKAKVEKQS